jgi:hypothetical protein
VSTPNAPRSRPEQFAFLREQIAGPLKWKGLCLSLARQAPGLPAIYPSALSAQHATPQARRYPLAEARRGMVAYFDDPDDSNPFGHIVTVAGWDGEGRDLDDLITVSNDAKRTGGVDVVRASFFPAHWGDSFVFATDWLNGYDLPGYDADKPTPAKPAPGRETIGDNLDHAIRDIRREVRRHRGLRERALAAGDRTKAVRLGRRVRALSRDLAELVETRKRFPA